MKINLLKELIELEASTTLLLEYLVGMDLQIKVEAQSEEKTRDTSIIKRVTKLYFDSCDTPALYCISYLNKNKLTDDEYQFLMDEDMPIGRLFMKCNRKELIHKKNIMVTVENDEQIAKALNVSSFQIYKKEYEYWIAEREIGKIVEIFNEESLNRISVTV